MALARDRERDPGRRVDRVRYAIRAHDQANGLPKVAVTDHGPRNGPPKVAVTDHGPRIDPPRVAVPGLGRKVDRTKGIAPAPGRKARLLKVRTEPGEAPKTGLPVRQAVRASMARMEIVRRDGPSKAADQGLDRPGPSSARPPVEGLSTIAARGPWARDHRPRSNSARPRSRNHLVGRSSGWIPNRLRSMTIGRNLG
jgi:hypothetical protein